MATVLKLVSVAKYTAPFVFSHAHKNITRYTYRYKNLPLNSASCKTPNISVFSSYISSGSCLYVMIYDITPTQEGKCSILKCNCHVKCNDVDRYTAFPCEVVSSGVCCWNE